MGLEDANLHKLSTVRNANNFVGILVDNIVDNSPGAVSPSTAIVQPCCSHNNVMVDRHSYRQKVETEGAEDGTVTR